MLTFSSVSEQEKPLLLMAQHLLTVRDLTVRTIWWLRSRSWVWRLRYRGGRLGLRLVLNLHRSRLYRCRCRSRCRLRILLRRLSTHDRIDLCDIDNSLSTLRLNRWRLSHRLLLWWRLLHWLTYRTGLYLLRCHLRLLLWRCLMLWLLLWRRTSILCLLLGLGLALLLQFLLRKLRLLHLFRFHSDINRKLLETLLQS